MDYDLDIPIPPRVHSANAETVYRVRTMPVGASIFIDTLDTNSHRALRAAVRPIKIAVRKYTQDGIHGHRIWKLTDGPESIPTRDADTVRPGQH